jgi:hypothetical protein
MRRVMRGDEAPRMRRRARSLVIRAAVWFAASAGVAATGCNHPTAVREVTATEVGKVASFTSLGASRRFFRAEGQAGTHVTLPIKSADLVGLQLDSIRVFRLDEPAGNWRMLPESRFDPATGNVDVILSAAGGGLLTVVGASQFEELFDAQVRICGAGAGGAGRSDTVPEICGVILCAGPAGVGSGSGLPGPMGDVCNQCLHGGGAGIPAFPECELPGLIHPGSDFKPPLSPWPLGCFDASNACRQGSHAVGQVDYDFPDALNLTSFPNVDVRATVRYPATTNGVKTPVAPGWAPYPLVVFLHGNHDVCGPAGSCTCNHNCAVADRIPNYLGYDYLLDVLASWGYVAVSIDAFDVTCASGVSMTEYEARGRLVLEHLRRWKDWNSGGGDPWGGLFHHHVDMNRVGLSGHSRGGEGVVAAEFVNRTEALGFKIKAVNAIAPTDQDAFVHYVPEVPYFLLLGSADGDISDLQGLRTYDRAFPTGAAVQADKSMLWVYGANHNFFNTSWTPSSGTPCATDDAKGDELLPDSVERLVACQTIVPFFRLNLGGESGFRRLFQGEVVLEGLDGVQAHWAHQAPHRRTVDDFEIGDNPATNTLGGAVTTSGGFSTFDEFNLMASGPDTFGTSFRHFTHGLVLGWSAAQTYETVLPTGSRDVSGYRALALRAGLIVDALNPVDASRAIRVALRTTGGVVANVGFDLTGLESLPYPSSLGGGKTVLTTVRIPLTSFRDGKAALPLGDIERVIIQTKNSGLVAIDDLQFTD